MKLISFIRSSSRSLIDEPIKMRMVFSIFIMLSSCCLVLSCAMLLTTAL